MSVIISTEDKCYLSSLHSSDHHNLINTVFKEHTLGKAAETDSWRSGLLRNAGLSFLPLTGGCGHTFLNVDSRWSHLVFLSFSLHCDFALFLSNWILFISCKQSKLNFWMKQNIKKRERVRFNSPLCSLTQVFQSWVLC